MVSAGTSCVTTLPAPTMARSPIVTFERIVAPDPIRDNRFRLAPATIPTAAVTVDSGREIDWLQIAIGFGAGAVLTIALFLAMRATRVRPRLTS